MVVLSTLQGLQQEELAIDLELTRRGANDTETYRAGPDGEAVSFAAERKRVTSAQTEVVRKYKDAMPEVRRIVGERQEKEKVTK